MVRVSSVSGSIFVTVPSREFATQMVPAPAAISVGILPTRTVCLDRPIPGVEFDDGIVALDQCPEGVGANGEAIRIERHVEPG